MTKTIEELLTEQNTSAEETTSLDIEIKEEVPVSEAQVVDNYTSASVIELLKKSLNAHWQQTTSLSAQAVHLERWGYKKLAKIIKEDALEEHQHAMINLNRLEFFDQEYQPLVVAPLTWSRHDMVAMIKYNLNSVREAAKVERDTIVAARAGGDEMTAHIMLPLLQGSEDGIELYEGFLKLIEQMGVDNFLTLQV